MRQRAGEARHGGAVILAPRPGGRNDGQDRFDAPRIEPLTLSLIDRSAIQSNPGLGRMGDSATMTSNFESLDAMTPFPSASQLGGRITQPFDIVPGGGAVFSNGFGCRSTLVCTNQMGIPK